jgi:ubiquinone biosynthesis protein
MILHASHAPSSSRLDVKKRQREVGRLIARYGFDWLLASTGIAKVFEWHGNHAAEPETESLSQPIRLRLLLEELGTTAIKLGQMASTRPDLLPAEFVTELSKLHDRAPKVPFEEIRSAIERELGAPPDEVFQTFERTALASASISQVHRATLRDGTRVVVKVRRPDIELQVEEDLAILGRLARMLSKATEIGQRLNVIALVEEFGYTLRSELDFTREGQNAEEFAAQFVDDPSVCIPKVYWDYSTLRVLTMQEMTGIKVNDLVALEASHMDRHSLAEACCGIALVQVLDHGLYHADPHPGNFFALSDGRVALLDFGMVGRVNPQLRATLIRLTMAISRRNSRRIADEILNLGAADREVDRNALERDLERAIESYSGRALGQVAAAKVYEDLMALARKHSLQLPSDLVMLARVAAMGEGLGAHLDPEFKLMEFAKPYILRFWLKSHSLPAVAERFKDGAVEVVDLLSDLPERATRLAGVVERGELTVSSRVEVSDTTLRSVNQVANRLAMSVLTAGLIVGLSVLSNSVAGLWGPAYNAFRFLSVSAIACGMWLLASFWKSARSVR